MSHTSIALDFTQSMDRLTDLAAQWTFHRKVTFKQRRQPAQFVFIQLASTFIRINVRLFTNFPSNERAHTIKIGKRNANLLLVRNINTQQTRHRAVSYQ
jgi:hypothetical protein